MNVYQEDFLFKKLNEIAESLEDKEYSWRKMTRNYLRIYDKQFSYGKFWFEKRLIQLKNYNNNVEVISHVEESKQINRKKLKKKFNKANHRLIFIDYDVLLETD